MCAHAYAYTHARTHKHARAGMHAFLMCVCVHVWTCMHASHGAHAPTCTQTHAHIGASQDDPHHIWSITTFIFSAIPLIREQGDGFESRAMPSAFRS